MLKKLFEPIRIGKMELRNRIVLPPMTFGWSDLNGIPTEKCIARYAAAAKGGVGLVRLESAAISPGGRTAPTTIMIDKDEHIPGLKKLADAVHKHGAKVCIQLVHCGKQGLQAFLGQQPVAPSAIAFKGCEMPRELTIPEIEDIIEDFGDAARRVKDAGFDAVELHGGHGFLLNEFLSPYSNKRNDKYGGDVVRRTRFAVEVVERIKTKCGRDYPVIFRMNGEDYYVAGGITLNESCIHARALERAGVDCLDVSGGNAEAPVMVWQPACWPRACFLHLADAIKAVVQIPVCTPGKIGDPRLAESILQDGKADLVCMGRALIADPEIPIKAKEGRFDDIRWCIRCMECAGGMWDEEGGGACSVNPVFGHESEKEYEITPAKKPKKVMVIGGGPAGMEAARVANLRGHKVSLYEAGDRLGGTMLLATIPPYKREIGNFTRYIVGQMAKLGVDVHLSQKVTPSLVAKIKPDAVVVATGGTAILPNCSGTEQGNVMMVKDVLNGKSVPGKKVVVIGGGRLGCEVAEFLADDGKQVTILEMLKETATGMNPIVRGDLLNRLEMKGVTTKVNAKAEAITPSSVTANVAGEQVQFDVDSVVVAIGFKADNELAGQLKGKIAELYVIGDCNQPRLILEAVREGYLTGLKI